MDDPPSECLPDFGGKSTGEILLKGDAAASYDENGCMIKGGKLSVIPSVRESSTVGMSERSHEDDIAPGDGPIDQYATLKQSKEESNSRRKHK